VVLTTDPLTGAATSAHSAGTLADHKQQLAQAIDANTTAFNANLRGERSDLLTNSLPCSVRVLLGALIVSTILFMITREI